MGSRRAVAVLVAALLFYLVLVADRGIAMIRAGGVAGIGLGLAVLALPLIGLWYVVAELRFGRDMQRLGHRLGAEGRLPEEQPEDLAAADAVFAVRKAEVEAAPDDWRGWYRLAVAYGDARDTARGRRAMRRAIALERQSRG